MATSTVTESPEKQFDFTPEIQRQSEALSESRSLPGSDALFSRRELEQFQDEDAEAGRSICAIMTVLFTISVLLVSSVIVWTMTRGLSQ